MRFGISYGNHGTGVNIEDVLVYVRNALVTAGEDAYILPGLLTDGVNILVEYFTPEHSWQISEMRKHTNARFIIIISEFTDGKRFNPHITSGEGHYVDLDYWKKRFEMFMEVAAEADALWSLSEYSLPEYQALFPGKPVLSFPFGFDPHLPYMPHPAPEKKDIDLLFTGHLTPHRKTLIDQLQERFTVATAPPTTLPVARVDLIRRSKASLHLNLLPNALYSSVMRHHFLIMSGAAVVSERARVAGPLDEFITEFDSEDFVTQVGNYLDGGKWKWHGEAMRDRYRDARPLADAVRRMLAESLRS